MFVQFLHTYQEKFYKLSYNFNDSQRTLSITVRRDEQGQWTDDIVVKYDGIDGFSGIVIFCKDEQCSQLMRTETVAVPRQAAQKIPKKIFQAWLQADNTLTVPAGMDAAIQSWKTLNPDYTHALYNDAMIKEFLAKEFPPIYLETYNLILPRAFKVDFWRYCVLYKYGGVYVDSKMTLMHPLADIIRPQDEFILTNDGADFIAIAFMAFVPNHPLLASIIHSVIMNVQQRFKGDHPLSLTGPLLAGRLTKLHLGLAGPLPIGQGPNYQFVFYSGKNGFFYDCEYKEFIKYLYDNYKKRDNQEWNHYPILWYSDIVFYDRVADPRLREIPTMRDMPDWLRAQNRG